MPRIWLLGAFAPNTCLLPSRITATRCRRTISGASSSGWWRSHARSGSERRVAHAIRDGRSGDEVTDRCCEQSQVADPEAQQRPVHRTARALARGGSDPRRRSARPARPRRTSAKAGRGGRMSMHGGCPMWIDETSVWKFMAVLETECVSGYLRRDPGVDTGALP